MPRKAEASSATDNGRCLLFSLPLELREKIYSDIFATLWARWPDYTSTNELAILQTCSRIQDEASSTLYNHTPLRFELEEWPDGPPSTATPRQETIDHFQNVYFKMVAMSTPGGYLEIYDPVRTLGEPFVNSTIRRKTCEFNCPLRSYVNKADFMTLLRGLTHFEILSITFEGENLKSEINLSLGDNLEPVGPAVFRRVQYPPYRIKRSVEEAHLADVETMLHTLETSLGPGLMLEMPESESVYAKRLVFHPLRHIDGKTHV